MMQNERNGLVMILSIYLPYNWRELDYVFNFPNKINWKKHCILSNSELPSHLFCII